MTKFDYSKLNSRDRMALQGADNIADMGIPGGMSPPKVRPSKAQLRDEATAAVAAVTRIVRCACGHEGRVARPPAKAKARLRCTKCGRVN